MDTLNQTVLVVVDSRRRKEMRSAEGAVFDALDHFGAPWDVYELGASTVESDFAPEAERDPMAAPGCEEFIRDYIGNRALYILAHDGAGRIPEGMARMIADAVRSGAGLLSFDREAEHCPAPLQELLGASGKRTHAEALVVAEEANPFLIWPHKPSSEIELDQPIEAVGCGAEGAVPVLRTLDGPPVVWTRQIEQGRVAVFGCGTELYDPNTCGHANGVTGLLWRMLVWAARKPFAMRSHPPIITSRFDDCTGSYDAFGYVDTLNEIGVRPNVGLFIDAMSEKDWRAAARLAEKGGADFSMHAFRDDLLAHDPGWRAAGSMEHKPKFDSGAFLGFTLDHYTGAEFDEATVAKNFREMDRRFAEHGLRHSRVINAHFAETSFRALPHFLERGADVASNNGVPGQLYGNQPVWRPRPFAVRTTEGRHSIVIDVSPDRSGLVAAGVGAPPSAKARMEGDVLWNHTPFIGECDRVDIEGALRRTIRNAEWALDAMAWGVLMAHEQRVACVPTDDWRRLVHGLAAHFQDCDAQFGGREEVAVISRRLLHSRLQRVRWDGERLAVELTGQTDGPSPLTVWRNEGDACRRVVRMVDEINGFLKTRLAPG